MVLKGNGKLRGRPQESAPRNKELHTVLTREKLCSLAKGSQRGTLGSFLI